MVALLSIRHEWILPEVYQGSRIIVARSAADAAFTEGSSGGSCPAWIDVRTDPDPDEELPERLGQIHGSNRATIRVALKVQAMAVLLEGKRLIELTKLSFIPALSIVSVLIQAFRMDCIRSVKPLLRSLERKGFELPPPEQMQAIYKALEQLGDH